MQFRIQFLDGSARVIRELHADARNAASAIELVRDMDWPPRAVTMRVLELDGREVHSQGQGRHSEFAAGLSGSASDRPTRSRP
jgi:hypothetical protein